MSAAREACHTPDASTRMGGELQGAGKAGQQRQQRQYCLGRTPAPQWGSAGSCSAGAQRVNRRQRHCLEAPDASAWMGRITDMWVPIRDVWVPIRDMWVPIRSTGDQGHLLGGQSHQHPCRLPCRRMAHAHSPASQPAFQGTKRRRSAGQCPCQHASATRENSTHPSRSPPLRAPCASRRGAAPLAS